MIYVAFTCADSMAKLSQLPFRVVESRQKSHDHGGNAFTGRLYTENGNNTSWMIILLHWKGEDAN